MKIEVTFSGAPANYAGAIRSRAEVLLNMMQAEFAYLQVEVKDVEEKGSRTRADGSVGKSSRKKSAKAA